jgi:hypothetical protein
MGVVPALRSNDQPAYPNEQYRITRYDRCNLYPQPDPAF